MFVYCNQSEAKRPRIIFRIHSLQFMQTFQVTFSRNAAIVLMLTIIPITMAVGIVLPIVLIPDIPEWFPAVAAVLVVGVSLGLVLYAYRRWIAIPAEVNLYENGIAVRLMKRSPFYRKEYSSTWESISNVSSNIDTQHNKRFYLITFRESGTTIQLMPDEMALEDYETDFGEALLGYVGRYNDAHNADGAPHIGRRGFYDAWWAKMLTWLSFLLIVVSIVMYFFGPEERRNWRLLQIVSISLVWLGAYYANKRGSRQKLRE